MLLVREIFHCKPGKVRPMVEKFHAMSRINQKAGMPQFRVLTDFSAERYWTIVAEIAVNSMAEFEAMFSGSGMTEELMKEMEKHMEGYHDLVVDGRREIFKIEEPKS